MSTLGEQDWRDIAQVLPAGKKVAGEDHGASQLSYIFTAMYSEASKIARRNALADAGIHTARAPRQRNRD